MGLYQRHVQPRLLNATLNVRTTGEIRQRVCDGLAGDVLEVGYGSGLNQSFLPVQVSGVWAVDPSSVALELSAERRAESPVPVVVAGGDAERLELPDDRFDAALSTWSLCSVADPLAVLHEVRRVLRPGHELHFVEHGIAPDDTVVRWQRRGSRWNKRIAGCVLDRDVRGLIEAAGLRVTSLRTYYHAAAPKPAGYFYEGRAASPRTISGASRRSPR